MVHTMMSTHQKWHLRLLHRWHLKKQKKANPVLLEPIMDVEVVVQMIMLVTLLVI
jgi:translation elongation factor EF-G